MNISKLHRGLITRTTGQRKLMDPCTRPLQDMPASTRASLAKEMPASEPGHHARIPCMLHLVMARSPNHTLINNCNIQMSQSAQEEVPGTQSTNPGDQDTCDARISQAKRCTRRVHRRHDACISWLPKMHASCMEHTPVGVTLTCCHSSAIEGSTPLRTNAGGSILPKTDPGGSVLSEVDTRGSISPHSYEHVWSAQQDPSTRRKS